MSPRITPAVLVVDGYGITLSVDRGHLLIRDGVADQRNERRLSRVERDIRRIVVLADTGTISLDAVRWCADVGITVLQIDRNGRTLLTAIPPGRSDARLRRAQARALDEPVGIELSRALISGKLQGQAHVAAAWLDEPTASGILTARDDLQSAHTLAHLRAIEAAAANTYFNAWTTHVAARFAPRATGRVPEHWTRFEGRRPPRAAASAFTATDPVNAMLNYLYRLAEIEARRACLILGLDPGLGIVHTDKLTRDSLALDLLEPVRPQVDAWLLQLLQVRTLTPREFHETRTGSCRLLAPLTHELALTMPLWAQAVAPHAEAFAHTLAAESPVTIRTNTRLTGARQRAAAKASVKAASERASRVPAQQRTCRECGTPLRSWKQLCQPCWRATQPDRGRQASLGAREALAAARAAGNDPTHTPEAQDRRRRTILQTRALDRAWDNEHPQAQRSPEAFATDVLPGIVGLRLQALTATTGLSEASCSLIRAGKLTPHPRHWEPLRALSTQAAIGTGS